MKQCPACKTAYRDDSLSFCLQDGAALLAVADEEPTIVRAANERLRVDVPPKTEAIRAARPTTASSGSSSNWLKILIAAVILLFVGLVVLGLAGAVVYFATGQKDPEPTPTRNPTPRPSPSPTGDAESERLKEVIANIQRKLDEQNRSGNTYTPDDHDDDNSSTVTARVNSPNDGFLALRSIPDADRGARLVKIPHGAVVHILNCEKNRVTVAGRGGRWCQVEYDGVIGWVFDAWLTY